MEIFMKGIDHQATKYQLHEQLRKILHDRTLFHRASDPSESGKGPQITEFASNRNINFRVDLIEGMAETRNNGTGFLTLPTRVDGKRFLQLTSSGKARVKVNGRQISFSGSRRRPREEVFDQLRKTIYQDPAVEEEREKRIRTLNHAFRIDNLDFGVWGQRPSGRNPGIFLSEWKKSYTTVGDAHFRFDYDSKSIRIQIGDSSQDEIAYSVIIGISNVHNIWVGSAYWQTCTLKFFASSSYCIEVFIDVSFDLLTPPIIESEKFNRSLTGVREIDSQRFRRREEFLDPNHSSVAPYAFQIYFTLYQGNDLDLFIRFCSVAGFKLPIRAQVSTESRNIFTPKNLNKLHIWFKGLDFPSAFQLELLLRNGLVHAADMLDKLQAPIQRLFDSDPALASQALIKLGLDLKSNPLKAPDRLDQRLHEAMETITKDYINIPSSDLSDCDDVFNAFHITFTPTRATLEGPLPSQSNRVIRLYPGYNHHFIRVDFREEDRMHFRWGREIDAIDFLSNRVGRILRYGFILAGRQFEFLGYSASALRNHSMWFVTPFTHPQYGKVDARVIRSNLGIFDKLLDCPSKLAARLALAFTATKPAIKITRSQWARIDDMGTSPHLFTDGIGCVSPELLQLLSPDSDAIQIRFLGFKGMICKDESLTGYIVQFRPSQDKFDEPPGTEASYIEIANTFAKPKPVYLNRALVMILEDRFVDAKVFLELQQRAVAQIRSASGAFDRLRSLFRMNSLGTAFSLAETITRLEALQVDLRSMSEQTMGDQIHQKPFFGRVAQCSMNTLLRDMKYRCRIPVPQSWKLAGVTDEGPKYEANRNNAGRNVYTLEEDEIFACIQEKDGTKKYLDGPCIISRSPTVHPGDVQRVYAIGKPPQLDDPDILCHFRNIVNKVVFPSKGTRSLPSCLSGGDLDGDEYDIIKYDPLLVTLVAEPAEYLPIKPKKIDIELLKRENNLETVGVEDIIPSVCDFVVEYFYSDVLGLLSDNHLLIADQAQVSLMPMRRARSLILIQQDGVFDPRCLELAELCNKAVDYMKHGRAVNIKHSPRPVGRHKPDWKLTEEELPFRKDFYESDRAVGKLFRGITLNSDQDVHNIQHTMEHFPMCLTDKLGELVSVLIDNNIPVHIDIERIFKHYSDQLRYISFTHTLSVMPQIHLSEEEIVVGTILTESNQNKWRRERIYRMKLHVETLVSQVKASFLPANTLIKTTLRTALPNVWFAWKFSVKKIVDGETTTFGLHSFNLIILDLLLHILTNLQKRDDDS